MIITFNYIKLKSTIDEKITKKKELENELEDLKSEISALKNQKSEIENARDLALQQKKMADVEIKSYTNAKQVLDRQNISINEDLPKLANAINRMEEYEYHPKRLIAELDIQHADGKKRALEIATEELEERMRTCVSKNLCCKIKSIYTRKIYLCRTNLQIWDSVQAS